LLIESHRTPKTTLNFDSLLLLAAQCRVVLMCSWVC
jgi:hypothetical protein